MAFIEGSKLLTGTGWKEIENISGKDTVLVRNFLGDAEFIQPFAIKKKLYHGNVIKFGARSWNFTVTPDHRIVYERLSDSSVIHIDHKSASDFTLNLKYRLYRNFRYMFSSEPTREMFKIYTDTGNRYVTISNYDWYKLVAYTLCRGFIKTGYGRPMLMFLIDENKADKEINEITDILDRIGAQWHVQHSDKTRLKIVVSSKNTLANKLACCLGSTKRKEMFLPDKILFNSTKELSKLLVESIIEIHSRGIADNEGCQISTTNTKLLDSLGLLCTLSGYSSYVVLKSEAGTITNTGVTKKNSYTIRIFDAPRSYSPTFIEKSNYTGYVYELDLFEGQVYVKSGNMPVWLDPK